MKILFFEKVIFEGTAEECETFRQNFIDMLCKLDDELQDTYPIKKTDTNETYFEALKILNPYVHETISYIIELVGEYFVGLHFSSPMSLARVHLRIYADLETKRTKMCALSYLFFITTFGLDVPTIWRIEE